MSYDVDEAVGLPHVDYSDARMCGECGVTCIENRPCHEHEAQCLWCSRIYLRSEMIDLGQDEFACDVAACKQGLAK